MAEIEITRLAGEAIHAARVAGAQDAEAFVEAASGVTLQAGDDGARWFRFWDSTGVGLRVLVGGRLGYAYSSDSGPGALATLAAEAVAGAAVNSPDPWMELPDPPAEPASELPGIARDLDVGLSAKVDLTRRAQQSARAYHRDVATVLAAEYGDERREIAIASTSGMAGAYTATSSYLRVEIAAARDGEARAAQAFGIARGPGGLDPEAVGREAATRAIAQLGAAPARTSRPALVLAPMAACQLLAQLARLVNGEAVLKGRSSLADRLGDTVAAAGVTVVDDPLMVEGPGARPFDAEGSTSRRTTVIEAGRLRGFLHNHYTGRRLGTGTTASARRSSYRASPEVGAANLVLLPGHETLDALLAAAGTGFYVTELHGMGNASPVTARFSAGMAGHHLRGGELGAAVREAVVSGNLLELFAGLRAAGSDLRFLPGSQAVGAPSLLLEGPVVSGDQERIDHGNR